MPVRAYSANFELAALRSITGGDDRVVSQMYPKLRPESFSMLHTQQAFMRIQAITRKTGEMPSWDDLLEDPRISQDAREELAHVRVEPVRNRREMTALLDRLDEYRRMRLLADASLVIQKKFQGESFDVDQLTEEVSDMLTSSRSTMDLQDHTTTIGGREPDMAILREALTKTEDEFIPTGIKVFDRENQGFPRGSCVVLAATTGGGKCLGFEERIRTSEGTWKIGELWNSVNTPVDADGFKPLDRDLFVQSHTGTRKRVQKVFKTRGRKMRVTFSNGAWVEGLPEHRIWIINGDGIPEFKRLDQISPGDRTIIHADEQTRNVLGDKSLEPTPAPVDPLRR